MSLLENYTTAPDFGGSGNHMVDSDLGETTEPNQRKLSDVEAFILKELNCDVEDLDNEKELKFFGSEITLCVTAAIRAVKEGRL
jgi:hypothetical protein